MRFINTPILVLLLGIVIGFAISGYFYVSLETIFLVSVLLIISLSVHLFLSLRKILFSKGFVFHAFVFSVVLGILVSILHNPTSKESHYTNQLSENQYFVFKGSVLEKLSESDFGKTFAVELHSADTKNISGKLVCIFPKEISDFKRDDVILFSAKCYPIPASKNMYQFDYQQYMMRKGFYWQSKVTSFEIENTTSKTSLQGIAEAVRLKMLAILEANFSVETASLLKTLLLGQRSDLDEQTYQYYIDAGAVHILAISGLHVGIITYILLFFIKKLPNIRFWKLIRLILLLFFLWSFAFLAGLSASVLRAVTMFSFVGISSLINRQQGRYDALLISAVFLLLFNPNLLYDVGFQLSYMAVFSILMFFPMMQKWWKPKNKFLVSVWSLFVIGFSAQVAVLPISLYYFHQFPVLFFVSNLLVVPLVSPILIGGFLALLLGFFDILPSFLVFILEKIIFLMNYITKMIAIQENFIIRNVYFDEKMLIFSFLVIFLLIYWLKRPTFKVILLFLGSILIFQGILFYTKYQNETAERLVVFHNIKKSLLLHHKNKQLTVYQQDSIQSKYLVDTYAKSVGVSKIIYEKVPYIFDFQGDRFLYLDSLGVYPNDEKHAISKVIMAHSPKINFERMLLKIKPKEVIADGTNLPFYAKKWQEECKKKGVLFRFTKDEIIKFE